MTSAQVGSFVGTGVPSREKLRDARGDERQAYEDQQASDDGTDPVCQADPRNRGWKGQQVIREEAE